MRLRLRPPPRGPRSHFSVWAAHGAAWGHHHQRTSIEIGDENSYDFNGLVRVNLRLFSVICTVLCAVLLAGRLAVGAGCDLLTSLDLAVRCGRCAGYRRAETGDGLARNHKSSAGPGGGRAPSHRGKRDPSPCPASRVSPSSLKASDLIISSPEGAVYGYCTK
jgi:hypothetical protein